ncbi:IucA/IucC family protein [Streptomyces fructofermentans]|uniref:IucA/IucC family protein n=1 Tax=Streptomyces fructofermentans TaxID=152141 RepID=UPI003F4D4CDA
MNATPVPDGSPRTLERGARAGQDPPTPQVPPSPHAPGPASLPGQQGGAGTPEHPHAADLLDHPDPYTAAQAAGIENLLRCWVREQGVTAPDGGTLRIPLPGAAVSLIVPVHHWSPTGWHRFGLPWLSDDPDGAFPTDAVTLAAMLRRETPADSAPAGAPGPASDLGLASDPGPASETASAVRPVPSEPDAGPTRADSANVGRPAGPWSPALPDAAAAGDDLVDRVADSVRRTAVFVSDRRANPSDHPDLFLSAEQSLLLGHPLHPTPKSREGLSEGEARNYSPELRGSFPLHWMAVAPSVLATDSAWTERGRPVPAAQLTARLAAGNAAASEGLPDLPDLPDGYAVVPMHPWQVRAVRHRPEPAKLLDAGLIRDLGPLGAPWHPTSSVRTLYRPGAPAMLKLSLGLRITNSRRENLRKELHRGVEVHRLLRAGLGARWQSAHPGFDIVRDPAWLAVNDLDGDPVPGIDVMIRHNPFAPSDDVSCVAGLVSPRPQGRSSAEGTRNASEGDRPRDPAGEPSSGRGEPQARSRLAGIVTRLAGRTGRSRGAVAAEWFLRYLEHVVRPVLWLDGEAGIALEAHQQNTLVLLDTEGWPAGGRYRDNQGYYFRESRRAELDERLPGIGARSDTFVSDEVADERFAYYLAVNNVLGLIGAFGSQRLADERLLLAAFRGFLGKAASGPGRLRTSLPGHLLDSAVLRCKANLLTRVRGLDELVGPVDTQSVYVTIANPLHSRRT